VRHERALQLRVLRHRVAERGAELLALQELAERRPAVGEEHPAPVGVDADGHEDRLRDLLREQAVQRRLVGHVRATRLQPHRAAGGLGAQDGRPRAHARLLDGPGARPAGGGEPLVDPGGRLGEPCG
jgi:hypothetical protein